MDRTAIIEKYMTSYNEIVKKYEQQQIVSLVEEINTAISKSDTEKVNEYFERISEWNNVVSEIQGNRDSLMAHDKSLRLPSIKEFLIIYDHTNKEWRFNTDIL